MNILIGSSHVKDTLLDHSFSHRIRANGDEPFWSSTYNVANEGTGAKDIADVTYYDDEATLITSKSPRTINCVSLVMFTMYATTVHRYGLCKATQSPT